MAVDFLIVNFTNLVHVDDMDPRTYSPLEAVFFSCLEFTANKAETRSWLRGIF